MSGINIVGGSAGLNITNTNNFTYSYVNYLGTCSTASATAAKEVAITGFVLATGARVKVKFTNANTAYTPTLNVESTGAKAIYNEAGVAVSATSPAYFPAGATVEFYYDGTNWVYVNKIIDEYKNGNSWYERYSNGKIRQGSLVTTTNSATQQYTLAIAMKDTAYSILTSNRDDVDTVSRGAAYSTSVIYLSCKNSAQAHPSGLYVYYVVEGF